MAADTKKKDRLPGVLIVGGVVVLGVLGVYAAMTRNIPKEEVVPPPVVATKPQQGATEVQVPHTTMVQGELSYPSETKPVPAGEDPMLTAVNGVLESMRVVPRGSVAKSIVVKDGVATIDFNAKFKSGNYGTDDESTVLNGILAAMGQFKGVQKVKFLVEGQEVETLAGAVDLTGPQEVVHATKQSSVPPN